MQTSRASDDEANNSRTVARPRVQLSDLPAELKSKIAQQCHAADVRLEECIEDASERVGDSLPVRLARVRSVRGSHRPSLGALYAVSKDWKNACAPYRFEVITTHKANKDYFILFIAPLYGQQFIKAEWTTFNATAIVELVKALPMLPNLRSFAVDGLGLRMLEEKYESQLRDFVLARLSSAVWGTMRQLVLAGPSLQQVLHLVGSAPLLSKLELQILDEEVFTNLWHILDATPGLTHLLMDF